MQGGGQIINADAPIGHIRFCKRRQHHCYRSGDAVQHWKPADTPTITIYGNKDAAAYSLYEDENENYNYERVKSASIQMQFSAATQTLTLQKRSGRF